MRYRKPKLERGWANRKCCGKGEVREGLPEEVVFQGRPE